MRIKKDFIGMFDVLKGLLILLVVTVHSLGFTNGVFSDNLFIAGNFKFYKSGVTLMGMFFVFAGYSFRPPSGIGKFFKKQAKQFLVPYAIVIALAMVAAAVRGLIRGDFTVGSVSAFVLGGLFGNVGIPVRLFGKAWMENIGSLWFLLALFFGSVFYSLIWRLKNPKASIALVWILTAIAVAVPKRIALMCPWTIVQSCAALGFMEIGRLFKKYKLFYKKWNPVLIIGILILWVVLHIYSSAGMALNEYRFLWIDYLVSAAGAVVFIKAYLASGAAVWGALAPLEYVGRYSMWFLCIHSFEFIAFPWNETEKMRAIFSPWISPVWVFVISDLLRIVFAVLVCLIINYIYGKILLRRYEK